MSDDKKQYEATPAATLEQRVMDPRVAKSEAEWWACREIERMRARVEMLERSSRELLDTLSAAVRSGNFTLSGSEDMSLFVNASLNKLEEATT